MRHVFAHSHTNAFAQHPALAFALALVAGSGGAYLLHTEGYILSPTPLMLALVALTTAIVTVQTSTKVNLSSRAFALVVALWWGMLGLLSHALWWQGECLAVVGSPETLTGIVMDVPRHTDSTARVTLAVVDSETSSMAGRKVSAWLHLGEQAPPHVGEALNVYARWRENTLYTPTDTNSLTEPNTRTDTTHRQNTPNTSNTFPAWLRRQGIVASGFVKPDAWQHLADSTTQRYTAQLTWSNRLRLTAMQWRSALALRYDTLLHDSSATAIAQSLTLGDRSQLSPTFRSTYSTAGASHVLALSGLHLGILYALIVGTLAVLPLGRVGRRCALLVAIGGLWGFSWLVGFPVSVVRSVLMYSLMAVAQWRMEDGFSLNNLGWAAVVVLLLWPATVADVGFQLSFVAVLGILVGMPLVRPYRPRWRVLAWGYDVLAVSLCAQVAVAPLLAYHFHALPLYFLVTNLVVALLAPLILTLGLATLLCPWWGIATALEYSIGAMNTALAHIASWPYSHLSLMLNGWQIALCYALMFAGVVGSYAWQKRLKNKMLSMAF